MTNRTEYRCTSCGREVGKLNLKVKRAVFKEIGKGGPVVKTRTTAWLCVIPQYDGLPSCLDQDPDWNRPLYSAAPGMENTSLVIDMDDESDEPIFPPLNEVADLAAQLKEQS